MATVGLVVNPSAGRDIRRLTGGASVSDRYAKLQTARCVLRGLTCVDPTPRALVMPDKGDIGTQLVEESDGEDVDARLLDQPVEGSGADTRAAAARFRDAADAAVVLGGDGTNRDVAAEIGDVPVASVSTGTNNVVPTAIDGTAAGAAASLVAAGRVAGATYRHGTVRATLDDGRDLDGLAALSVLDRPFVGTRAVLDAEDYLGGVVSRAGAGEIGLPGIAGAQGARAPADPGGVGLRLVAPDGGGDAGRSAAGGATTIVRAVTMPGVVGRIGVAERRGLAAGEPMAFDVSDAVLSADGERELEVGEGRVEMRVRDEGPRLVDFDAVFAAASRDRLFAEGGGRERE